MTDRKTIPHRNERYELRYHLVEDYHTGDGRFLTFAADIPTARAAKKTWARNDTVSVIWIVDRTSGKRVE